MAVIGWYASPRLDDDQATDVLIEVGAEIVGVIERGNNGRFYVKTKGLIPAIDDIIGTSFDDVWAKIAEAVRSGEVKLIKPITDVRLGKKQISLT